MKHQQGNPVPGRTNWSRFAAVVIPAAVVMAGLMGGVASGSVPVQLKVSGQTAMLTADKLDAKGFSQYTAVVVKKDGTAIPVAASQIKYAEITNLCQSVRVPGTGLVLFIRAGREPGKPVVAKDLLIGMDYLAGDATFTGIDIGTDASALTKGGPPPSGRQGQFGQEADTAVIEGLKQRFYTTQSGEFHLNGMTLALKLDGSECFSSLQP